MKSIFSNVSRKDQVLTGILIIFHCIGLVLMHTVEDGAKLSYFNLMVCAVILFIAEGITRKNLLVLLIIFVGGIAIEWIGVHTGILFGNYGYGEALGWKIDGIPLIIGLNWFNIVLASTAIIGRLPIPLALKAIGAGLLAMGLDILIEPVAIKLDYWSWGGGEIPIFNYVCWFAFSTIFAALYLKFKTGKNFPAKALFIIWALFFIILNFTLK